MPCHAVTILLARFAVCLLHTVEQACLLTPQRPRSGVGGTPALPVITATSSAPEGGEGLPATARSRTLPHGAARLSR